MGQDNSHPEPGDLFEIDRPLYQHWALYLGNGYVINLTPAGKQDINLGVHEVPVFTRKVKKQVLKEVVRNNKWHVNNKYDCYHSPLPVKEIIRRAEGYIGKEATYPGFGSNCEHFVTMLRYCDQRAFVHGEMHTPDMTDDKCHPKPGDLIEIERPLYQHWALYLGGGYVIHMTDVGKAAAAWQDAEDENAPPLSASTVTILTRKAKVKKQLLKEVVGNNKCRVNNKYDRSRTPLPMEEIVRHAERWIDREVPYGLFLSNCEHFVTELCCGEGVSDQVGTALLSGHGISTAVAGIGAAGALAVFSAPFLAAAGVSLLASIGFGSGKIAHYFTRAKFFKAQRDILEQKCC